MTGAAHIDTIAAIATPSGRGGIGVLRISGPDSSAIAERIIGIQPAARYARFAPFHDTSGNILDRGIALYFPAPHSYTGEDVLELQGHGGDAVMQMLLQAALDCGARQARPGEFTERAFLNDKIDLLQAEATADLIESASSTAARSALRSLEGRFSDQVNRLQHTLTDLRVRIEGALDFPDEDVDHVIGIDLTAEIMEQQRIISDIINQANQGRLLHNGIEAVIVGKPNVGKSSLINRLVEREAAIVTDIPGTTRDLIRDICMIDGLRVALTDTAGLRDSEDAIEQEGVRRANEAMSRADIILWVHDQSATDAAVLTALQEQVSDSTAIIEIRNKIDKQGVQPFIDITDCDILVVGLSALTGAGIDNLRNTIKQCIGYNPVGEDLMAARERHVRGLKNTQEALQTVLSAFNDEAPMEIIAESLRQAQQSLAELTGESNADDLLGEIFSRFCIGK